MQKRFEETWTGQGEICAALARRLMQTLRGGRCAYEDQAAPQARVAVDMPGSETPLVKDC